MSPFCNMWIIMGEQSAGFEDEMRPQVRGRLAQGLAWRMETSALGAGAFGWSSGPGWQTAIGGRKEELMEHSRGQSPPNGSLAEAKLWFSKKTWLPARCEGAQERGRRGKFCGHLLPQTAAGHLVPAQPWSQAQGWL